MTCATPPRGASTPTTSPTPSHPSAAGRVELRARPVRPTVPLVRAFAPLLLTPSVRLPHGWLAEVVPLAPLRQGVASVRSTAGECDVTPNARCGVRLSVKTSPALRCGPAAPIHHPMMMSTTPTTMRCCCSATPSWRQCCCPACRRSTSSPSRLPVRPGHFHHNPTGLP